MTVIDGATPTLFSHAWWAAIVASLRTPTVVPCLISHDATHVHPARQDLAPHRPRAGSALTVIAMDDCNATVERAPGARPLPPPPAASITHQHILDIVVSRLRRSGRTTPVHLLDAGCGDGALLEYLARGLEHTLPDVRFEFHGFDVFDHGVQPADYFGTTREMLESRLPGRPWVDRLALISDRAPWPWPGGRFDVVVSNQVLEHVRDHRLFLSELARSLAPDGFSVHVFPTRHCIVEPHFMIPFAHRLRGRAVTQRYIEFATRLGMGRFDARRETRRDFARRLANYLAENVNYRSVGELFDLAAECGLRASLGATPDLYVAKARAMLGRPRTMDNARRARRSDSTGRAASLPFRYLSSVTLVLTPAGARTRQRGQHAPQVGATDHQGTIVQGVGVSRMRLRVKTVLKTVLVLPGLLFRHVPPSAPGLRVLLYHRVNPHAFASLGPVSREITVRPEAFARQLGHLRRHGYRTLSPEALIATLRGDIPVDRKALVITFDDGYEDNLEWAAPLLREHGYQAIMFVTTSRFGEDSSIAGWGADAPGCGRYLTVAQLREWVALGMFVGSHTHTHGLATRLGDAELLDEFVQSRRILEAECGVDVRLLAYPDGDYDARAQATAMRAGYTASLTTAPGMNTPATPPHALRRTEVSASDTFFLFRMKLAGALDWLWFKEARAIRRGLEISNRLLLRVVARGRA